MLLEEAIFIIFSVEFDYTNTLDNVKIFISFLIPLPEKFSLFNAYAYLCDIWHLIRTKR